MTAASRVALILSSQAEATISTAGKLRWLGNTASADELIEAAAILNRLADAVDSGQLHDIVTPLGTGPGGEDEDADDMAGPRMFNDHRNDIGDRCPWSKTSVTDDYDDDRCPAGCRSSWIDDDNDQAGA